MIGGSSLWVWQYVELEWEGMPYTQNTWKITGKKGRLLFKVIVQVFPSDLGLEKKNADELLVYLCDQCSR